MKYEHVSNGAFIWPTITDRDREQILVGCGLASHTVKLTMQANWARPGEAEDWRTEGMIALYVPQAEELIRELQVAVCALKGEKDPHGVLTDENLGRAGAVGYIADSIREVAEACSKRGTP